MPQLSIQLFGDLQIRESGHPLPPLPTRVQSLLAYLLLNRHAPQPRHHLAFLFWPDSREPQAHTNLRNLVFRLRRALPDAAAFLELTPTTITWRPDSAYRLDVAQFEQAIAAAHHATDPLRQAQALRLADELYTGPLLPKLYDDWLIPERMRLQDAICDGLERLIRLTANQGDTSQALEHAHRLLLLDPLREPSYRTLMHLYASCQDRAGLLRTYQRCAHMLAQEFGTDPSPLTRQMVADLLPLA